ncbi:MAG: hypothetical protein P4L40_19690 [Terracidiphilus sp.]|nr:hypothetical protein [Terracidiphilus sp.]
MISKLLKIVGIGLCAVTLMAQEAPKHRVLVSGTSQNQTQIQNLLDGIQKHLSDVGVNAKVMDAGSKGRSEMLDQIGPSGAESMIWITLDIAPGQRDSAKVQCFDSKGTKLWEEQWTAGLFSITAAGEIKSIIKDMSVKLDKRIGTPGLPKG